jgi:hypothetical protein
VGPPRPGGRDELRHAVAVHVQRPTRTPPVKAGSKAKSSANGTIGGLKAWSNLKTRHAGRRPPLGRDDLFQPVAIQISEGHVNSACERGIIGEKVGVGMALPLP